MSKPYIIIKNGLWSAVHEDCRWERGQTAQSEVANAWCNLHDCEEDVGKIYDDLGL